MFKETREMIDSTVYTNGNGEVTAKNINLAFHGVIDATEEKITEVEENATTLSNKVSEVENKVAEIEENGMGGSGALRVWINEAMGGSITEEQRTENLASLDAIINGTGGVLKVMYTLDDVLCTLMPISYYGIAAEGAVISVYIEGKETYYILEIDGSVTIG